MVSLLVNSTNLSTTKQMLDRDAILSCSKYFLSCLQPRLFSAKGTNIGIACIKDICIRYTYTKDIYIEDTYIRSACVRGTCIRSTCIRSAYIDTVSAVKHLEIYL